MESFLSFNSDSENEDRLYCSALQNQEDIIWAGSDTEQTAEEIERKHLRYEHHAKRYLQGKLPVLMSASLKGPLGQDWVNPWRYRARKVPDWWQPGSKDMLFTKANVMKRAAEHNMGHLKPKEALAWCKAEAEAEARRTVESLRGSVSGASEGISEEDQEEFSLQTVRKLGSRSTQANHNYSNHHEDQQQKTVSQRNWAENMEDDSERPLKRPADSQWLKGSYMSKRAKWGSPAISSPTPMPDFQVKRERKREQHTMQPSALDTAGSRSTSNPEIPWMHGQNGGLSRYETETSNDRAFYTNDPDIAKPRPPIFLDSPCDSSISKTHRSISIHQYDVHDCESQAGTLVSGARHSSEERLQGGQPEGQGAPLPAMVLNDMSTPESLRDSVQPPVFTPKKSSASPNGPGTGSYLSLRRRRGSRSQSVEDISFVTEIAPSSRDLEHFHFRRKRRRSRLEESVDTTESLEEQHEAIPGSSSMSITPKTDGVSRDISNKYSSLQNDYPSADSDMDDADRNRSPSAVANRWDEPPPPPRIPFSPTKSQTIPLSRDRQSIRFEDAKTTENTHFVSSRDIIGDLDDFEPAVKENDAEVHSMISSPSDQVLTGDFPLLSSEPRAQYEPRTLPIKSEPRIIRLSQEQSTLAKGPPILEVSREPAFGPNPSDYSTQSYNSTPMASLYTRYNPSPAPIRPNQSVEGQKEIATISQGVVLWDSQPATGADVEPEVDEEVADIVSIDKRVESSPGKSQVSRQKHAPQSPWTIVNVDPIPTCGLVAKVSKSTKSDIPECHEPHSLKMRSDETEWQSCERPKTPEAEIGIKPFKDFMTPTPSPPPPESCQLVDNLPNTQQLLEATMGNPWTSAFKKPASGKSRKRVSFGILPSEEKEGSSPILSSRSKKAPASPPLPQTRTRFRREDGFDDGTTVLDQFEKHFRAAGGFKRILPGGDFPSCYSSSPSVGAMAEAFIEADREVPVEQERHRLSDDISSRYLTPISKAKANINSLDNDIPCHTGSLSLSSKRKAVIPALKTIDYDIGIDIDDFLGEAGGFLEEWSVEAELKKTELPNSISDSARNDKRRSIFGIGGW